MTEQLFHIVDRKHAEGMPGLAEGLPVEWRFALFKRMDGYVYGQLVAVLYDYTEAQLVCRTLNTTTKFIEQLMLTPLGEEAPL